MKCLLMLSLLIGCKSDILIVDNYLDVTFDALTAARFRSIHQISNNKNIDFKTANSIIITAQRRASNDCLCVRHALINRFHFFKKNIFSEQQNENHNNSISIVGFFPNVAKIFKLFHQNGFRTVIGAVNSSEYVLSPNSDFNNTSYTYINHSKVFNFLYEDNQKVPVFVYSHRKTRATFIICNFYRKRFENLTFLLAFIYSIIFILRLLYYRGPILIKSKNPNIDFWILGANGAMITKNKKKYRPENYSALKEMYDVISKTGIPQNKIMNVDYGSKKTTFERVHMYMLSKYMYLVVNWIETFDDSKRAFSEDISGVYLSGDSDSFQNVSVNIEYELNNESINNNNIFEMKENKEKCYEKVAYANFKYDGSPCSLRLRAKNSDGLPFGISSLNYYYLHELYFSIVREIGNHNRSLSIFTEFAKKAFTKLDFEVLSVFICNDNKYVEIIGNYKTQQTKDDNLSYIRTIPKNVGSKGEDLFLATYNGIHYGGVRFTIASDEYVFSCALKIENFVIRPVEARFVFIMQLIFSFHHSVMSPKSEHSILQGLYDVLDSTSRHSIVRCVGRQSNFVQSYGKLFGKNIKRKEIELFCANLIKKKENLQILKMDEKRSKLNQIIVPFTRDDNTISSVSISGIRYFDETVNDNTYLYFVEDVSYLHAHALKVRKDHESVAVIEDFSKLYRIHSDFSIEEANALSEELGYQTSVISNLSEVVYCEDVQFLKNPDLFKNGVFRLMGANNYPLPFVRLPLPNHTDFFIACIWKIRAMLKIAAKDVSKNLQRNEQTRHFLYMTIDIHTETPIDMISNFKENYSPQGMYNHIKAVLYEVDLGYFESGMEAVKNGTAKNMSLILRMRMKGGHEWFNFTISKSEEDFVVLYVSSCNKQVRDKLRFFNEFLFFRQTLSIMSK